MTREELLHRLDEISNLDDNWNLEGAKPINRGVIINARKIITDFENPPHFIAPVSYGTIQLEWENNNGYYIEIELEQPIENRYKITIFILNNIDDTQMFKSIEFEDYMLIDNLVELFINS